MKNMNEEQNIVKSVALGLTLSSMASLKQQYEFSVLALKKIICLIVLSFKMR